MTHAEKGNDATLTCTLKSATGGASPRRVNRARMRLRL